MQFKSPRLFRLLIVVLLVLFVTSVAQAQTDLPVPREETIFLEDSPGPYQIFDSFNPRIANGNEFANGYWQIGQEYLFLANFATGEVEPWLATGFEYNDDYTQLTISLRDDVTWNDGTPFTADDIIYTIETVKANEQLGGSSLREFVDTVSAPDPHTLQINLTKPAPRFIYEFYGQVTGFSIWPKHIWENEDPLTFKNNPPVSTSVWKLSQVLPDLRMFIWERDDNYWGANVKGMPEAKYVIYRNAPASPDVDYQEFVANTIDHAHNLQWFQVELAAAENPAVTYGAFQDPCPRGVWINNQKYPLSLPEVRHALSYIVNREKIATVIWQPPTTPATHPWSDWALLQQYIDPAVLEEYKIEYSPEKAVAILDELGFAPGADGIRVDAEGNPLTFSIATPVEVGGGEYQIAQDIADEAAKIGIQLNVEYMGGGTYWDNVETGNFDIGSHWLCGAFLDPLNLYQPYTADRRRPGDGGEELTFYDNWPGVQSPALDDAVARMEVVSPDTPEGKQAYSDALRAWMEQMPVLPIVQTIYVMPWNTTYWEGWPVDENMYTVPFTWWATFYKVPFALTSTGGA